MCPCCGMRCSRPAGEKKRERVFSGWVDTQRARKEFGAGGVNSVMGAENLYLGGKAGEEVAANRSGRPRKSFLNIGIMDKVRDRKFFCLISHCELGVSG